ncbi:hypothetical protein FRC08_002811 [Ceratobasidium sp. 394]|nr:hypothetical protein FRC08_002811 [Ceratobasidium sp. 394]
MYPHARTYRPQLRWHTLLKDQPSHLWFSDIYAPWRGGSNENATLGGRVTTGQTGPRRHFLFCTLHPEKEKKGRTTSRDITSALAGTSSA